MELFRRATIRGTFLAIPRIEDGARRSLGTTYVVLAQAIPAEALELSYVPDVRSTRVSAPEGAPPTKSTSGIILFGTELVQVQCRIYPHLRMPPNPVPTSPYEGRATAPQHDLYSWRGHVSNSATKPCYALFHHLALPHPYPGDTTDLVLLSTTARREAAARRTAGTRAG